MHLLIPHPATGYFEIVLTTIGRIVRTSHQKCLHWLLTFKSEVDISYGERRTIDRQAMPLLWRRLCSKRMTGHNKQLSTQCSSEHVPLTTSEKGLSYSKYHLLEDAWHVFPPCLASPPQVHQTAGRLQSVKTLWCPRELHRGRCVGSRWDSCSV